VSVQPLARPVAFLTVWSLCEAVSHVNNYSRRRFRYLAKPVRIPVGHCGNVRIMTGKELRDYFAKMGKRGGKARTKNLTPEQRKASARKAAQARWAKKKAAEGWPK
jgi:hypothetical protein